MFVELRRKKEENAKIIPVAEMDVVTCTRKSAHKYLV